MSWLSRQFRLFSIAGIPIRLDYSWFAIFLVYTWVIASMYLPSLSPGMSVSTYWLLGTATVILLFISVLIHEMAHSVVAKQEGIGVSGITLYIFGGLSHLEREPETPLGEFKIAAAGPAASFSLALIFYALAEALFRSTTYGVASRALLHLGAVNLLLACFNLLPGFPLDGGRILRAIIWHRRKDYEAATRASFKAGATIGFSLVCVGIVTLLLQHDWLTGLWSIITGLLLVQMLYSVAPDIMRSIRATKQPRQKTVRTVEEVMTKTVAAVRPEMLISEFLEIVFARQTYTTFPVVQERRLHGILLVSDARKLPLELRSKTPVRELMQPVMAEHFVAREMSLDEAAARLAANGFGRAAVLDADGFVVGYLSMKDLQQPAV